MGEILKFIKKWLGYILVVVTIGTWIYTSGRKSLKYEGIETSQTEIKQSIRELKTEIEGMNKKVIGNQVTLDLLIKLWEDK